MQDYIPVILSAVFMIISIVLLGVLGKKVSALKKESVTKDDLKNLEENWEKMLRVMTERTGQEIQANGRLLIQAQNQQREETAKQMSLLQSSLTQALTLQGEANAKSFSRIQEGLSAQLEQMNAVIGSLQKTTHEQISELRNSVSAGMESIRNENSTQLKEIRKTVDEQLQDALDKKLKQSFDSVVEQLGLVQKGLGEMQTLANSVGDLKKVLSNTKSRGILGEAQLGAILEQLLSGEQYETNVVTVKGSREPVEFAIKLPGNGEEPVFMPIDSKFPLETYQHLLDAYDGGDASEIENAKKLLEQRLFSEAKDVSTKYIHVPETTEFGIIFLPIEGLYAECVRLGLSEKLQERYKIMIAGPTTMAAMLNSLQMGFRTLAIQKRSAEVWKILGNVKSEFNKFEDVLEKAQNRISQTGDELEKLVGVRTRQISRALSGITDVSELEQTQIPLIDNT